MDWSPWSFIPMILWKKVVLHTSQSAVTQYCISNTKVFKAAFWDFERSESTKHTYNMCTMNREQRTSLDSWRKLKTTWLLKTTFSLTVNMFPQNSSYQMHNIKSNVSQCWAQNWIKEFVIINALGYYYKISCGTHRKDEWMILTTNAL